MTDGSRAMLHILEEPQMRQEVERLQTFQNWPADAAVSSSDLARAGFFFLGSGDKVQCFCCGGVLRYWVDGDCPAAEHKRHFPTCSFILGRSVGNIPLQAGSSDSVDGQLLSQLQRMTMEDQGTAGQAVYPEMEAEDSRLTTFHNWPTEASVQPDILARAGFFYTGTHLWYYLCLFSIFVYEQHPLACFSEIFSSDLVTARVHHLCDRVHGTIVLLSHDVVDRTTWTKLGRIKKEGLYSFRLHTAHRSRFNNNTNNPV